MKLNLKIIIFTVFISFPNFSFAQNSSTPKTCDEIYNDAVGKINGDYLTCLDRYNNYCNDESVCIDPNCDETLYACSIAISDCDNNWQTDLANALDNKIKCEKNNINILPIIKSRFRPHLDIMNSQDIGI